MKKSFFVLFASLASSVFADPTSVILDPIVPSVLEVHPTAPAPLLLSSLQKQGFFYARFAAGERNLGQMTIPVPGFGLGYRRLAGDGAVDLSFNGIGSYESQTDHYFWTAPKTSYYHYLQPNAEKSLYVGAGLAWGGVASVNKSLEDEDEKFIKDEGFIGIIPSVTIGYEFAHKANFLSFSEFTLSQPALAVIRQGKFPSPIAEVSVGIGF